MRMTFCRNITAALLFFSWQQNFKLNICGKGVGSGYPFWRILALPPGHKKKIWAEGGLGTTTTTTTRTRRTRTRPRKDYNNDHHSKPTGLWRKHGIDFRLLKPSKWWIANLPDFPSQSLQSDGRQTKVTDSKPRGLRHKAMETKPAGFWRKQG